MGHALFGWGYERLALLAEKPGAAAHRDELLAGASGRVIEVGSGSGVCFAHYPKTVTEIVALEPGRSFVGQLRASAPVATVPIRVLVAVAERLPADNDRGERVTFW